MLLAHVAHLKTEAKRDYQVEALMWVIKASMGAKIKPPELPQILKEK